MELSQEMATVSFQLDCKVFARVILALFQRGKNFSPYFLSRLITATVLFLISLAVFAV